MEKSAGKSEMDADGSNPANIPANLSPETEYDGEDMLDVLLKWLDETNSGSICNTNFQPDSVTINGNDETCGSSFSASRQTVMAGIDADGSRNSYFFGCEAPPPEMVKMAGKGKEERKD